jgi:hypothetical protein
MYWNGPFAWGDYPYIVRDDEIRKVSTSVNKMGDAHLRSTCDVRGYHIQATDGEIGHADNFIVDDATWTIRYLIIDTRNWLPGKKVLISPLWIDRVSWHDSKIFANLSREAIIQSPEYTDWSVLTREFEIDLYQHYKREGYWVVEPVNKENSPQSN